MKTFTVILGLLGFTTISLIGSKKAPMQAELCKPDVCTRFRIVANHDSVTSEVKLLLQAVDSLECQLDSSVHVGKNIVRTIKSY